MKTKNLSNAYLAAIEDMRKDGVRVREIALRTSSLLIRPREISDKQRNGRPYFNYK